MLSPEKGWKHQAEAQQVFPCASLAVCQSDRALWAQLRPRRSLWESFTCIQIQRGLQCPWTDSKQGTNPKQDQKRRDDPCCCGFSSHLCQSRKRSTLHILNPNQFYEVTARTWSRGGRGPTGALWTARDFVVFSQLLQQTTAAHRGMPINWGKKKHPQLICSLL